MNCGDCKFSYNKRRKSEDAILIDCRIRNIDFYVTGNWRCPEFKCEDELDFLEPMGI